MKENTSFLKQVDSSQEHVDDLEGCVEISYNYDNTNYLTCLVLLQPCRYSQSPLWLCKNVNPWHDGSGEPRPTELVAAM